MPLVTHVGEAAAEFHVGILPDNEGGEAVLQPLHDILQGNGLRVGGRLIWGEIGELHHRLVVEHLLELLVLLHDSLVFLVLKPVATPLFQFIDELCVEHVMSDVVGIVDLVGIDADEAARACWVDQRAQVIGGGDEGGKALALFEGLAIGRSELHVVLRNEVLEDGLLRLRHSIELVDVDEVIAGHRHEDVAVVLHREAVVVIHL